jgi:tRNA-Thr(GGU) m(6)t(6)A37 methyltransferase TsaA
MEESHSGFGPVILKPIGIIHTTFSEPRGTPIQSGLAPGHRGRVEVFEEFAAGLEDVEGFSHLTLIYHMNRSGAWTPRVRPFLDEAEHGVFATRSPRRPNPLGMTTVRLLGRDGRFLDVDDVDMVDGTPLLDIKPHVPAFDHRENVKIGWFTGRLDKKAPLADDRFAT